MDGTGILTLLSTYGTPAILAIIIIYIIWLVLTSFLSAKLKNFFSGTSSQDESKKNELKFHTFFSNAEYRIVAEIPSLEIMPEKPVKERMYKDLILIETKVIYDSCLEIIDMDFADWSAEQWQNAIAKKVTDMISTISKKCREEGIPDIVIIKYNRWNMASFDMLYEYIKILGMSATYPDNLTRTNTLLIIMNLLLVTIVADAEKSLRELNGEVAGKQYKGLILED